jgi:hypothetical protein
LTLAAAAAALAVWGASPWALAEEGMWTFDNPPLKQLEEQYQFRTDAAWLEHVRLASVRVGGGGSGSFVSPDGLLLTNHHVGLNQIQKLSGPGKDLVRDGFYAKNRGEEMKCPDLEVRVLISMEDVTARVAAAIPPGASGAAALQARRAAIARLEKEDGDRTGLESNVIALYQGGEYWLYRYRKYTDVRLVFCPEQQAAFFGGDPDNFTYPRHDLDMTIFRVYHDGAPLKVDHYLKWNSAGAAAEELVFVSGHPGKTNRLYTLAQLELQRDLLLPRRIASLKRTLGVLQAYSARGPEEARQALTGIFGVENSLKSATGEYEGMLVPRLLERNAAEEKELRARVAARPEWQKEYGSAWTDIAEATKRRRERVDMLDYLSLGGYRARLASNALSLVQYAAEVGKPDTERLDGYHDAELASLRFRLLSRAPVYPALEEVLLADFMLQARDQLGADDAFVRAALGGREPADVAREVMAGTRLADPQVRKQLFEGGAAAVAACDDPLIALARRVDPVIRERKRWLEETIAGIEVDAGEKIGRARFAVYGKNAYPDATGTLRLSYGTVAGYPMNGTLAQPLTTFHGLYDRALGFGLKPPYDLPARFLERKDRVRMETPLNFVSTCDIIGGNSGSPVVNRAGELVGLVFDGNIESLVGRFVFDITANRTVSVHAGGMIHALRVLYDAGALADEMEGLAPAAR